MALGRSTSPATDCRITSAADARRVLGAFDGQIYPTPFKVRFTGDDLETVKLEGFSLVVDGADRAVSGAILGGNGYEPHVEQQLRTLLQPGMTFVDVGANIGYHAFLAASLVGPNGRVVAFEASSENCRMLLLSRFANDAMHVDIRPVALDREPGIALLGHHIGTNAGLAAFDAISIARGDTDVVAARRFDDEVDSPVHVVKVDVEGAELRVLQGATATLERDRPAVIMEFSCEMVQRVSGVDAHDALAFVTDRGYDLSLIEKPTGRLIPYASPSALLDDWGDVGRIEDLLFLPNNR